MREEKTVEKNIEELIYKETEMRLKVMGANDYKFPHKADKMDALGIIAAISISLLLIVFCMTEVIV